MTKSLPIYLKTIMALGIFIISISSQLYSQCPPGTGFIVSSNTVCSGTSIQFNDTTSGSNLSCNWNFGDGTSSNLNNPIHTFPDLAGTGFDIYVVQLTTTDSVNNCSSIATATVTVNRKPIVYYWEANNFKICLNSINSLPYTISVYNYSDILNISSYTINWGDGSATQNITVPFNTTTPLNHVYLNSGNYLINITAIGLNGCITSTTETLSIISNPVAQFMPPPSGTNTGCTPVTLSIINTSTHITPSTLTVVSWGDGISDSLPLGQLAGDTLTHTYLNPTCDMNGVSIPYFIQLNTTNTCGSSYQVYYPINVFKKPIAIFTLPEDTVCVNNIAQFSNISLPNFCAANPATFYRWNFGDSTMSGYIPGMPISPTPDITHIYTAPGIYDVTLEASNTSMNGCGLTDTTLKIVVVQTVAEFMFDSVCINSPTHFIDSSITTGGHVSGWLWEFGDGLTSTLQNPIHTYLNPGNYNVILHATGSTGCTDTASHHIIVYSKPQPNFYYTHTCFGDTVHFIDLSTPLNTIISRNWDFGDGTFSTIQNPAHHYNSTGIYQVTLTLTNVSGCVKSITLPVIIRQLPNAAFSINSAISCAFNQQIVFTDSSTSPNGVIQNWTWFFGDGSPSSNIHNPSHTYNSSGSYLITLIVTDPMGCIDTVSHLQSVNPLPFANFKADTVCLGSPTHFTDLSNQQGGTPIHIWKWKFGDNTSDTLNQNPTHIYSNPGSYVVKLVVFNLNGCSDTITHNIWVDSLPSPNFTSNIVCIGVLTNFTQTSVTHGSPIVQWNWLFGDGGVANTMNSSHLYASSGTFTGTLQVTNSKGCSNQITHPVVVYPYPIPDFFIVPSCLGQPTQFLDSSNGMGFPIVSWSWNFGDGTFSTVQNPIKTYNSVATYNIQLTIHNANNCFASITKSFVFDSLPDIHFHADTVCLGSPTHFYDMSISHGSNNVSWLWYFGDGASSSLQFPTHTYSAPGIHNVSLIVTNLKGCLDTLILPVLVDSLPKPQFTATNVCLGNVTQFNQSSIAYGGANIINWNWTFGDGNSSTLTNPSHVYAGSSAYTVSLQVTDNKGCSSSVSHPVNVYPLPVANFSTVNDCFGYLTTFSDSSFLAGANLYTVKIFFGDGGSALNILHPTHVYSAEGIYNVIYIISNTNGCIDTIVKPVIIDSLPTVFFITDTVCKGSATQFFDYSQWHGSPNVSWRWYFGDGGTSTLQHPLHVYPNSGVYNATLIVTNQFGCSDTIILPVRIDSLPTANFSSINVPFGSTTPFTDISVPHGSPVVGWQWFFGDGTSSNQQNPSHLYAHDSTYTVMHIVRDANGCIDTIIHTTTVYPLPLPNFTANAVCLGDTSHFSDFSLPSGSPITSWFWNFGDGNTSTLHNPFHLYANPGTYLVKLKITAANGSSDSITKNVKVYNLPIPNFTSSISCFNTATQFNSTSSWIYAPIVYYNWTFGDGGVSANNNPSHQYPSSSISTNYNVVLTVTDTNGCSKSITHVQVVYPEIMAEFISDTACSLSPIHLVDQSTSPMTTITSWQWNFGNGSISNLQVPVYSYPTVNIPTYYPVRLVITDSHFCRDTVQHLLLVNPLPQIVFSNDSVCFGMPTHFYNYSYSTGGAITNWQWTFDGVGQSTSQQAVYTFSHWGFSNTSLTATDTNGCSRTLIKQVLVDSLPIVDFSWSNICATTLVDFYEQTSSNAIPISTWYWNFGDSNYSSLQNPNHYFSNVDTFNIILTVTNSRGCSNHIAHPIYVNPSLEFTFTADTVCKGEATTFTYSVLNPNTHIVAWNWNFGDGNTSIAPNPIHQYALAGNYNVSLTVLDSTNCMETITKLVHVFSLPLADFTVNNVCLGSSAVFYDYSSGMGSTIVSREWNFGDGNIVLGGITHTHTYANTGSYTCHLVIMNANGCIDTVAKIVNVIPIPQANFSFADACFGNNTLFTDNSNSNNTTINTWLWNFGDSNTFFIPSPSQYVQQVSHFYNSPGIYQASLIISNSTCGDTASYTIVIDSIPEAHFIATSACFGDSTQFTDQSIRTDYPIAAWFWTFGDGFTSTLQSPSHLYTSTGNFLVSLTVTDTKGCKDSIQQMVTVNSLPVADFSFVPANVGSPVAFSDLSIPNGGVISAWLWDFGDGNFSSLQNPSNVYANPGFYNVVERVTNIWGCWDTASQTVMVNSPFIAAAFTFVTGCVGSSTIFTDSSSIGWGSIIKWWWNFGDGFSSVLQNPTHTYSSAGTYIVSLIVEGSYSNFDTIYHTIEVHSIPTANFTSSAACVGALTNFTNASGVVAGNIIVSNWDFGDGSTSSAFNTYNIYADTGSYPVRLIVISDMGCTDTITKIIIISAQPEVHFSSNVTDGCEPLFVTFYDSSFVANGLIGSWFWNFGDGNTSNSPVQAAHSYLTTGIYDVTLKVISESGCANMLTINNLITVHPNPTADFSHSPDWVTDIDGQVWFTDLSFGASNWNWDFGNGAVSYVQSPATIYTQQGSPIVTLVVSNTYGCKDTARHVINVYHDDAFYIPNAFTPTSDNLNSYFGPYGEDLGNKHFSMTIWDRWGGLVFSTNNYAFLWDGKSKNGTKCAIGTYVYKIFLDDKNGESKVYQGYVTLVK